MMSMCRACKKRPAKPEVDHSHEDPLLIEFMTPIWNRHVGLCYKCSCALSHASIDQSLATIRDKED